MSASKTWFGIDDTFSPPHLGRTPIKPLLEYFLTVLSQILVPIWTLICFTSFAPVVRWYFGFWFSLSRLLSAIWNAPFSFCFSIDFTAFYFTTCLLVFLELVLLVVVTVVVVVLVIDDKLEFDNDDDNGEENVVMKLTGLGGEGRADPCFVYNTFSFLSILFLYR